MLALLLCAYDCIALLLTPCRPLYRHQRLHGVLLKANHNRSMKRRCALILRASQREIEAAWYASCCTTNSINGIIHILSFIYQSRSATVAKQRPQITLDDISERSSFERRSSSLSMPQAPT